MATPVIKRLHEYHANDDVFLLTTHPYLNFFSSWEHLNLKSFKRFGLFNTIKQILWIRKNRFDRIYDLQSNDRTAMLCALSGASFRAGNHPRFPYNKHPEKPYYGQCHSFERLNSILTSAGISQAPKTPFLYVSEKDKANVQKWLDEKGLIKKNLVLIHAGSSAHHKQKRWPYFDQLAKKLATLNFTVIWIGAKEDAELNNTLSQITGIDATGLFVISELVELGKHAKFAITNDSAPMHMLSCCGIPLYGLFGPTNPRRTHALGHEKRVIFAGGELPENDNEFKPTNIANIAVKTVIDRLQSDGLLI